MGKETETCGRCGMSSVVDTTDGEADVVGEERIEVSAAQARAVSPGAWLGGLKQRLDDIVARLTYGR